MKTKLHTYRFDIRLPDEAKLYGELRTTLRATPGRGHWMESHGGALHYCPGLDGAELELDRKDLFDNQWNAKTPGGKGIRVFDWAQDYNPNGNPNLKQGHYLDITQEMVDIRINTWRCGYCGAKESILEVSEFCKHCIDSEYLTEKDLPMLRMRACSRGHKYKTPELSAEESAWLLPLFKKAQIHGNSERGRARVAERILEVAKERDRAIRIANTEHDGLMWLLANGINTSNCIFYKHTGKFSFGWRSNGIDPAVYDDLVAALEGFPFEYEITKGPK